MGRYCDWEDVIARYNNLSTKTSGDDAEAHAIPLAEAELDSRLAPAYTVPFSNNNQTAKDLSIDLTYLKMTAAQSTDARTQIHDMVMARIDSLVDGNASMLVLTDSDTVVPLQSLLDDGSAWSTTQTCTPIFNKGPTILQTYPDSPCP